MASTGAHNFGLGRSGNWTPDFSLSTSTQSRRGGVAFRRFSTPPGYTYATRQEGAVEEPPFGYGSGARKNRGRVPSPGRQDDRQERAHSRGGNIPQVYRMSPTGPEEARDWSHALDQLSNNVQTLERVSRAQAHALATAESHIVELTQKLTAVEQKANTTELHLGQACTKIVEQYCTTDFSQSRHILWCQNIPR